MTWFFALLCSVRPIYCNGKDEIAFSACVERLQKFVVKSDVWSNRENGTISLVRILELSSYQNNAVSSTIFEKL